MLGCEGGAKRRRRRSQEEKKGRQASVLVLTASASLKVFGQSLQPQTS